ncbi:hypothetical protein Efla_001830 [Eimeria flavescens]
MSASKCPIKPERRRCLDGRFRCYKCPGELAVAAVREKCCRSCLSALVRKAFAAEFSGLRRRLAQQRQQQVARRHAPSADSLEVYEGGEPLFIALSGGDGSLALLHVAAEQIQRRLRARCMQRQKQKRQDTQANEGHSHCGAEQEADFDCCVALHVDMQRLWLEGTNVTASTLPAGCRHHASLDCLPAAVHGADTSGEQASEPVLRLPTAALHSLPFQVQQEVAARWPSVPCVLLHPLGFQFSIVEQCSSAQQSGSYVEVYRELGGGRCTRERLQSMLQQEEELRQLLTRAFAEDKAATAHLCRALMLRALRLYFSQRQQIAGSSQGAPAAFLCVGDSMATAALAVLERVAYGEGRLLGTESASVDDRQLPLFHLCRPVVDLSSKELALFRQFEGLSVLPTQPYLLHEDVLSTGAENVARNSKPSVRWLLQDFLIDMQKDNSATLHNLISASRKMEPTFAEWRGTDIPCRVCWKAPAVDLREVLREQDVFTAQQMKVAEEHLVSSAAARLLCFACIRDAAAGEGAARVSRMMALECGLSPSLALWREG